MAEARTTVLSDRTKATLLALTAALAAISVWWLVAPPQTRDGYREEAAQSAEALVSNLRTARLWAQGIADGEVTRQAASVGLQEAETAAQSTASSFESLQPARGQRDLRSEFAALATEATDVLGRVRIAARAGQWSRVPRERAALEAAARRLEAFAERARR